MSQADWDRLKYYSRRVKSFRFYDPVNPQVHPSIYRQIAELPSSALFPSLRHLRYDLGNTRNSRIFLSSFISPLLDSLELVNFGGFEDGIVATFLATLTSQMISRIILHNGQMSVDIFKESIVHFKHLRSLELSDAVFMSDFVLWEVLGTLPSLANFTLKAFDPASHPAHAPESSNSQSGGPKYFEALECLFVKGSFTLILHLLGFIDSPYLKSIEVYPVITRVLNDRQRGSEDLLTPSMTIVASKWSQSLKNLIIGSSARAPRNTISNCLMLLTDLHEMQSFQLHRWKMENMDDDVRRLVMSWRKLRTLAVLPSDNSFISLYTLRIIAESCPELRHLSIHLNIYSLPPFDISNKSLAHNMEVLTLGKVHSNAPSLGDQIRMARHLDSMFPYLKSIELQNNNPTLSGVRELVKLCQDFRQGR